MIWSPSVNPASYSRTWRLEPWHASRTRSGIWVGFADGSGLGVRTPSRFESGNRAWSWSGTRSQYWVWSWDRAENRCGGSVSLTEAEVLNTVARGLRT